MRSTSGQLPAPIDFCNSRLELDKNSAITIAEVIGTARANGSIGVLIDWFIRHECLGKIRGLVAAAIARAAV